MRREKLHFEKYKKVGLRLVVIGLALGLIVMGLGISKIVNTYKSRQWTTKNLNAVVALGEEAYCLVAVQPEGNIFLLDFRGNALIPVTRGYGKYRLEVLDELAQQEGLGDKLVTESFANWFGVAVEGVVRSQGLECLNRAKLASAIIRSQTSGINWFDRWRFGMLVLRADNQEVMPVDVKSKDSFKASGLLNAVELKEEIHEQIESLLTDQILMNENVTVSVINKTEVNGLADETSQLLKSMGYDVVINDWRPLPSESRVRVDASLSERVEILFPLIRVLEYPLVFEQDLEASERALVVVELAEDHVGFVRGKI